VKRLSLLKEAAQSVHRVCVLLRRDFPDMATADHDWRGNLRPRKIPEVLDDLTARRQYLRYLPGHAIATASGVTTRQAGQGPRSWVFC